MEWVYPFFKPSITKPTVFGVQLFRFAEEEASARTHKHTISILFLYRKRSSVQSCSDDRFFHAPPQRLAARFGRPASRSLSDAAPAMAAMSPSRRHANAGGEAVEAHSRGCQPTEFFSMGSPCYVQQEVTIESVFASSDRIS